MSSTDRQDTDLSVPDTVWEDLLGSSRRCQLLVALAGAGGEAPVRDLATEIRNMESKPSAAEADSARLDQLQCEIYDRHLPKLTATGVVEYDSVLGKLRLTAPAVVPQAKKALKG